MSKVLIAYASQTGNTELMAEAIGDVLEKHGHQIVTQAFDFDWVDPEDFTQYDGILVGTHTWDDGEMPYEVEDFYEDLEDVDIKDMLFGVFGSGDSFYDVFGGAIDLIAERLENLGGIVVGERLKVDLEPDKDDIKRCQEFAENISKAIRNNRTVEKI